MTTNIRKNVHGKNYCQEMQRDNKEEETQEEEQYHYNKTQKKLQRNAQQPKSIHL